MNRNFTGGFFAFLFRVLLTPRDTATHPTSCQGERGASLSERKCFLYHFGYLNTSIQLSYKFTSWATTATSSHEEGSVTVTTQFKPRKIIHCRREECVARRVMMAGGVTKFGLSWGVPHYSFPGTFLQASFLPSGSSSTGPEGFLPTCTAFWQPALLCRIQQHHFPGSCVCERVCVCV